MKPGSSTSPIAERAAVDDALEVAELRALSLGLLLVLDYTALLLFEHGALALVGLHHHAQLLLQMQQLMLNVERAILAEFKLLLIMGHAVFEIFDSTILPFRFFCSRTLLSYELLLEHRDLCLVAHANSLRLVLAALLVQSQLLLAGLCDSLHLGDARLRDLIELLLILFSQLACKLVQLIHFRL